ncbi:AtuA-related protein [Sphingomonas sp. CLY1604]|uniref:AtuA-related protein n=1 Tax=Sphingomonas sp. CLY1604 TaxID=3457786 RepID=UPI003FD8E499
MLLHDVAHARTGDKGNISDISIFPYARSDYDWLCATLTTERIATFFSDIAPSRVERFLVPKMFAIKFVLFDALQGGVTRTLNLDCHGKSLGSSLLAMELSQRPAQELAWHRRPL